MTNTPDSRASTNARRDDSPLAVALVAVALLGVIGVVFYLSSLASPQPPLASEHYFPLTRGASFTYRITNADGSVTYRSRNINRQSASAVAPQLEFAIFSAMMNAGQIDVLGSEPAVALEQLRHFDFAQIRDVEYDTQGNEKNRLDTFVLMDHARLDQIGLNTLGITPAIPVLPTDAAETITGTLSNQMAFRVAQEIETRGAFTTAIGDFSDCVRVHAETVLNNQTTTTRTWYCAGIGQVAEETSDANGTQLSEIIAASIGALIRGSSPALPNSEGAAQLKYVFPQALAGTPVKALEYQEARASSGVATNILPYNGLLLYGTPNGALVALERASERERWRFQTGDAIYGAPVVANGTAYFGSADKKIYAVRATDGSFVWAFRMNDVASASPFVSGNTVYVASEDRTLYALDADTGRPRWRYPSSAPLVAQPIVGNDMLFGSNDDGAFFGLNAVTGTEVWTHSAPEAIFAPATVADGAVYIGSFSHNVDATDRNLFALNARDGKTLWDRELGDDILAPVIAAQGRVFAVTHNEIFAFDATGGAQLWRYKSDKPLKGAPVVMGNQVWTVRDGELVELDANTGALLNTVAIYSDSSVNGGVSSDGRELYVGFFDGTIQSYVGVAP